MLGSREYTRDVWCCREVRAGDLFWAWYEACSGPGTVAGGEGDRVKLDVTASRPHRSNENLMQLILILTWSTGRHTHTHNSNRKVPTSSSALSLEVYPNHLPKKTYAPLLRPACPERGSLASNPPSSSSPTAS